jgi:Cytochrome C and Quinol oxidase polypeptide I
MQRAMHRGAFCGGASRTKLADPIRSSAPLFSSHWCCCFLPLLRLCRPPSLASVASAYHSTLPSGSAIDLTPPSEAYGTWLEQVNSWVVTVDHKKIGLMYIGYALIFLLVGGFEAILLRIQLAVPHNNFLSPEVYNRIFTMHGTAMVFFMGMPLIIGFANYLVPLMIGARDMAFPRMNACRAAVKARIRALYLSMVFRDLTTSSLCLNPGFVYLNPGRSYARSLSAF